MAKYNTLNEYVDTFNEKAYKMYRDIREIAFSVDERVKERLFAGQVAYYIEDHLKRVFHESPVLVLSYYKDHVNIFASANTKYIDCLQEYSFTPKGTMQIQYDKTLDIKVLTKLFSESLGLN